jgi:hypothetical protein
MAEKPAFFIKFLEYSLLDGVLAIKPPRKDFPSLAKSMAPLDRLSLYCRVPPTVKKKNIIRRVQIQPDSSNRVIQEHDLGRWISLKLMFGSSPCTFIDLPVVLERSATACHRLRFRNHFG